MAALIGLALIGLVGTGGTAWAVNHYASDVPTLESLSSGLGKTTTITDRNDTPLASVYTSNRTVVTLDKISPKLQDATIATEDRSFWDHTGVDYRRLLITAISDVTHRSSAGGSTITEQVVKLDVLNDSSKNVDRKARELLLAEELERRYAGREGKKKILELYLNSINYGNQAYGSEAAARTYFDVHAADLDLAQASFLAGLPQLPSRYDPFGSPDQRNASKVRWGDVLDGMVANHAISQGEAQGAASEDIWGKMDQVHQKAQQQSAQDPVTAHFVQYILNYLEANYNYNLQGIKEGGLLIKTSLDLPTQKLADQQVKAAVKNHARDGINTGALLAMDSHNGEILAMVGSADFNNVKIRGQVNLTVSGQPVGSTFKPYTYAAALATGAKTAATIVNDQDEKVDGVHQVFDWDLQKKGLIPLRQALYTSRNIPAEYTYKQVGGQNVMNFARSLGVNVDTPDPGALSNTLGTGNIKMIEHVAGYSSFSNGGLKVMPHPILKMTDQSGRLLSTFDEKPASNRVMSTGLAYVMTDILKGAVAEGNLTQLAGRPVASKSGTTEYFTHSWWMGYTPDITVGTMMTHLSAGDKCDSGFTEGAPKDLITANFCPTNVVWGEYSGREIFQPFLLGYYKTHRWPATWALPPDVVTRSVCIADGSLAPAEMPAGLKRNEIFVKGVGEPPQGCVVPTPSPSPSAPVPPPTAPFPDWAPTPGPSPSPHGLFG